MSKTNYKKVDVNIPFVSFAKGEEFEGVITGSGENDKGERHFIGEKVDGNLVKLGGYQVENFMDNFYVSGKMCKITFSGKIQSKGGREVNDLSFEMED